MTRKRDHKAGLSMRDCLGALLGHAKVGVVPGRHMIEDCEHVLSVADASRRYKQRIQDERRCHERDFEEADEDFFAQIADYRDDSGWSPDDERR